jgi:hypothetical protein
MVSYFPLDFVPPFVKNRMLSDPYLFLTKEKEFSNLDDAYSYNKKIFQKAKRKCVLYPTERISV